MDSVVQWVRDLDWTAIAAVVQAVTAIFIVFLTRGLVKATKVSLEETQVLAREAKRTNDLAERNFERTLRRTAASLLVRPGGHETPSERSDSQWAFIYTVDNVGEGIAHEVSVSTGEGEASTPPNRALQPGRQQSAWLLLPPDFVSEDTPATQVEHPAVGWVTFQDPDGTWWTQRVRHGRLLRPEVQE